MPTIKEPPKKTPPIPLPARYVVVVRSMESPKKVTKKNAKKKRVGRIPAETSACSSSTSMIKKVCMKAHADTPEHMFRFACSQNPKSVSTAQQIRAELDLEGSASIIQVVALGEKKRIGVVTEGVLKAAGSKCKAVVVIVHEIHSHWSTLGAAILKAVPELHIRRQIRLENTFSKTGLKPGECYIMDVQTGNYFRSAI